MSATAHQTQPQAATTEMPPPVTLRLRPVIDISTDQLLELSSINDDLRFELSAEGDLIIMSPTGSEIGDSCSEINFQLRSWAKQDGAGRVFGSSTGFALPNGAKRSPDVSWIAQDRWETLSREQRRTLAPLCPDFVVELKSPSDRITTLKRKMDEWIDSGARLGRLIDPDAKHIYIYRPNAPVEQLANPESVSGEPVLPSFTLDLREIW